MRTRTATLRAPRTLPTDAENIPGSSGGLPAFILYRSRGAVERESGRLKHEWALLPLRVRGVELCGYTPT